MKNTIIDNLSTIERELYPAPRFFTRKKKEKADKIVSRCGSGTCRSCGHCTEPQRSAYASNIGICHGTVNGNPRVINLSGGRGCPQWIPRVR